MSRYQAYAEYKSAECKWLDVLPESWTRSPLKHLVKIRITDGPHETPDFVDEGIPFLSAEAVKNNKLDFDKKRGFITPSLHEIYSKKCLPKLNDVFMIKSGNTTGSIAIVETDEVFNIWSPLALIRADTGKVCPRYIYYSMQADFFKTSVELSWSQGTQPNIGMGVIENLVIPVPAIYEQKFVIDFLDHETAKIDLLIEKQQGLIALLKEKRQAVISHAVTKGLNPNAPLKDSGVEWLGEVPEHWDVYNLDYALSAIGDVDHYMPESVESGIPYVMTGDLKEFASGINFEACKQVSHSDYLTLSKKIKCSKGDVIMARYATIGTAAYVDIDFDFLVSYSCVTIKPNDLYVVGLYLFYYFKSDAFLQGIQSQINTNTQGNVGVNDLKKIKVALPPLIEQAEIIEYLQSKINQFDCLSDRSEMAIALAKERRTALISAAVTGKIDVRNWQAKH